jgi:ubiquinone/menaquinone biosynthesis C-methylase UbiE
MIKWKNRYEPAILELLLTRFAFCFYGKSVYKDFAQRLPIKGHESVLDFGCGMGSVAFYTAERLSYGKLTCLDISKRWLSACRKTLRNYNNIVYLHCKTRAPALVERSYDIAYCHYVLHDISENDLEHVIPNLAVCLKEGGVLVFREPLRATNKLHTIKSLAEQSGLSQKSSRITDFPLMGNSLESHYIKK